MLDSCPQAIIPQACVPAVTRPGARASTPTRQLKVSAAQGMLRLPAAIPLLTIPIAADTHVEPADPALPPPGRATRSSTACAVPTCTISPL